MTFNKIRRTFTSALLMTAAAISAHISLVSAAESSDSEAIIHERQEGFKNMGSNLKSMRFELRADQPDYPAILKAATNIHTEALKIADWFPAGTSNDDFNTDALPYIWKNQAKFNAMADDLVKASEAMMSAASSASATEQQMLAIKDACSACHRSFRAD